MNIKQTIVVAAVIVAGITAVVLSTGSAHAASCGGVETSIVSCTQPGGDNKPIDQSGAWGVLLLAINIMTAGIGILAVGGIVYGAILYTTAGDKAEQTKKAVTVITNVVVGILAYGLMYGFLQYLVPGGVFN